jgi:hypothetical protein
LQVWASNSSAKLDQTLELGSQQISIHGQTINRNGSCAAQEYGFPRPSKFEHRSGSSGSDAVEQFGYRQQSGNVTTRALTRQPPNLALRHQISTWYAIAMPPKILGKRDFGKSHH